MDSGLPTGSDVAPASDCLGRARCTLEEKAVVRRGSVSISTLPSLAFRYSESASPYPADSLRKTVVGVKRSEDVVIDTGSNVGRGLTETALE